MLPVEPGSLNVSDEELTSVRSWTCVCHRENSRTRVLQLRAEFIRKFVSRSAGSGSCRISALDHEIWNDTMKSKAVIESALREIHEIRYRHRRFIRVELSLNRTL